jgi:hypothetical protein
MIVIVLILITIFIIHLWAAQDSHIQNISIENIPHDILICLLYETPIQKKHTSNIHPHSQFLQKTQKCAPLNPLV